MITATKESKHKERDTLHLRRKKLNRGDEVLWKGTQRVYLVATLT